MNTDKFKGLLLEEKTKLEEELATVGRKNPDYQADWEATPGDVNQRSADMNKLSSNIEEYETHTAILKQLEKQLLGVDAALEKIKEGKYGICEETGEKISEERLAPHPTPGPQAA